SASSYMKPMTAGSSSKAQVGYDDFCAQRRSRQRSRSDLICFHSQQCVEKYLKARLYEAGVRFPRTNDLIALLNLLAPVEPLWVGWRDALRDMADSAIVIRYPGKWTTGQEASDAYETCTEVRAAVRATLGLKA